MHKSFLYILEILFQFLFGICYSNDWLTFLEKKLKSLILLCTLVLHTHTDTYAFTVEKKVSHWKCRHWRHQQFISNMRPSIDEFFLYICFHKTFTLTRSIFIQLQYCIFSSLSLWSTEFIYVILQLVWPQAQEMQLL